MNLLINLNKTAQKRANLLIISHTLIKVKEKHYV